MNIEEIAKKYTRVEIEERIRYLGHVDDYIHVGGIKVLCPNEIGLHNGIPCSINKSYKECKQCWNNAIKNIKFKDEREDLKIKQENKINKNEERKDKELTFKEVIANIKEGEIYTLVQGNYRVEKIFMKNNIIEIVSTDEPVRVGGKERYIKEKSSVSFMDAIRAYKNGDTISCKWNNVEAVYPPSEYPNGSIIDSNYGRSMCAGEILEGKWYIE